MKFKSGNIFIAVGLLLIGAALLLTFYNLNENFKAKKASEAALELLRGQIDLAENDAFNSNDIPLYKSYSDMNMPEININGDSYIGILKISTLGLELPVKGQFSYPDLTSAPCRYMGSVYTDNMIVAGHNYSSHFGYLKRLKTGDEVSFTDGDGNVFMYRVAEILQLDGTDVQGMQEGEWDLTLFTCTFSGKSRVTVRLDRISN